MILEASTDLLLNQSIFSVGSVSKNSQSSLSNTFEKAMMALKSVINGVFPSIDHIHGFWVEFYFPNQKVVDANDDVYGNYAANQGYIETPNLKRRVPVTGAMVDRMSSGDQLDSYFGPPPIIWMTGDYQIPEETLVRILTKKQRWLEFKVDRTDAIYGMDDALIQKLILSPMASQF